MEYTKETIRKTLTQSGDYKFIKDLLGNSKSNNYLVGGAILDILAETEPKDFDIISSNTEETCEALLKAGCDFLHVTKTAFTFKHFPHGQIIQVLKAKDTSKFDFTINQTEINLKSDYVVYFDAVSYNEKTLIPTDYSFSNKHRSLVCLKRKDKMESKGFMFPIMTQKSLSRGLTLYKVKRFFGFDSGNNVEKES
jgi:hypothetical protein